jgi:hypothetical protein
VKSGDAGFFEKNFLKLKDGQHLEYMLSRIILFITGMMVGLYYLRDALSDHSKTGIPESILLAAAVIFLMNGLRKMVRGFIKLREAAWDGSVSEKPHNPGESWFMRVGFRFPLGQRRHLVNVMALLAEGFAALLMVVSFFSPAVTFPMNIWWGLVITGTARILSYINGMIFLTRIPQVRKALAATWKGVSTADHLLLYFPTQAFELLRGARDGMELKPCDEDDAERIAECILREYPEHVISNAHKVELHPELVGILCTEHDPKVLVDFLRTRIELLKKRK